MLPVAWSFFNGLAIGWVLPVLWMAPLNIYLKTHKQRTSNLLDLCPCMHARLIVNLKKLSSIKVKSTTLPRLHALDPAAAAAQSVWHATTNHGVVLMQ